MLLRVFVIVMIETTTLLKIQIRRNTTLLKKISLPISYRLRQYCLFAPSFTWKPGFF